MKANRKDLLKTDNRAEVGIGTMIVFIATILVAATAAAVLIDTSGKLQERSSATGNEATKQVASNLVVAGVYGVRTAGNALNDLNITVGLAPGASPIDLEQVKIRMTDGDTRVELDHADDCGANDVFCIEELRDPKATMSATVFVLSPGGLVNIQIDLDSADAGAGMLFAERTEVILQLIPEVGSPIDASFTTPPAYGDDLTIILR